MSFANVFLYAGLLILVVYQRIQGRAVGTTKQLFGLPIIITLLGFEDFSHAKPDAIDIAVGVAGCALSLILGALRGTQNKLNVRDGVPWVRWGAASVAIFAVNIVAKLVLDGAGVAVGGSTSGITASLVLAVGLMLVGEAAVVSVRLQMDRPATLPAGQAWSPGRGTSPALPHEVGTKSRAPRS
jgi:hypothetical protein